MGRRYVAVEFQGLSVCLGLPGLLLRGSPAHVTNPFGWSTGNPPVFSSFLSRWLQDFIYVSRVHLIDSRMYHLFAMSHHSMRR